MTIELMEHQVAGAAWLAARGRGYLGDPPGMGKTYTIGAAAKVAHLERPLVITPAIVRTHWVRQMSDLQSAQPIVKSFDEIVRGGYPLMADLIINKKIDSLIVDEAHYCKHPTSQRSRLIMGRNGYARRLACVWLASGTPMPKNPAEIYTQIAFLAPELVIKYDLGTYEKWKERFCVVRGRMVRGVWTEKVVDVQNAELLKEILDQVMLRREDGVDLPEIWWQTINLDAANLAEFTEMHNFSGDLEMLAAIRASRQAAFDGRLEDIASDPHVARMRRRLGELKVAPVVEMLRTQLADSYDKVAVFAHHKSVLHELRAGLSSFGVAYIDGDVPDGRRDLERNRFINDSRVRVFIGQNQACGTGMDGLQHATNRAVLVEPDWTAVNNVQLGRRVARTGQRIDGKCKVQFIALAGTLDEAIVRQNERETRMADAVFGKGDR